MSKKFLGFRSNPLRPFDFKDEKRFQLIEGRSYKLLNPDMEKDKLTATAHIKVVKAPDGTTGKRIYIQGVANAKIEDRMQEVLDPVGLDVVDYLKNSQLLAHHSYYHPIGQVDSISIEDDGVKFSAWIGDPEKASSVGEDLTAMQREIRSLVAQGVLKTVSVGFIPKKIRAPLYGENGELQEPCVIEQWELLELSIVAVPCNQDSIFQVRELSATLESDSTTDKSLKDRLKEIGLASELIFDKAVFTENDAKLWVAKHLPQDATVIANFVDESQEVELEANEDLLELVKGVHAVKVKKKDGAAAADATPPATDAKDDSQSQMVSLMQQMSEGLTKLAELCGSIMAKLEEKPGNEDEGGETPEKPEESEPAKGIDTRITAIEKNVNRMAQAIEVLAKKVAA